MTTTSPVFYPPGCSTNWTIQNVDADQDITGFGVIVSFLFAAWLGWLGVVAAWWTDSLPTLLDDRLLWLRSQKAQNAQFATRNSSVARRERVRTMQAFLVALSDQQLATGLSVLIAGLAQYHTIDIYSMNMVADISYLAAMVHVSTLVGLRQPKPHRHRLLRLLRTTLMLCSLIILLILKVLQIWWQSLTKPPFLSFACVVQNLTSPSDINPIAVVAQAFFILSLLIDYGQGIYNLWSGKYEEGAIQFLDWWSERTGVGVRKWRDLSHRKDATYASRPLPAAGPVWSRTVGPFVIADHFGFRHAWSSVEWDIGGLLLNLTFATTTLLTDRQVFKAQMSQLDAPKFGQLVPLLILLLPAFAAIQGYNDYCDAVREAREGSDPTKPIKSELLRFKSKTTRPAGRSVSASRLPASDQPVELITLTEHRQGNTGALEGEHAFVSPDSSSDHGTTISNHEPTVQPITTSASVRAPDDHMASFISRRVQTAPESSGAANVTDGDNNDDDDIPLSPHRSPTIEQVVADRGSAADQVPLGALARSNTAPPAIVALARSVEVNPLSNYMVRNSAWLWVGLWLLVSATLGYAGAGAVPALYVSFVLIFGLIKARQLFWIGERMIAIYQLRKSNANTA